MKSRDGKSQRKRREEKSRAEKRRDERGEERRGGEERRREEEKEKKKKKELKKRKSQKKEDPGARKGRKVAKRRVFPLMCGSGGSKTRLAKAAGAEPAGQVRDEKLHAVVARSRFASEKAQTPHVWGTFGS